MKICDMTPIYTMAKMMTMFWRAMMGASRIRLSEVPL